MFARVLFGLTLTLSTVGCIESTPVTTAPLAAEEVEGMRAALVGEWRWIRSIRANGSTQEQRIAPRLNFSADGMMTLSVPLFFPTSGAYHIEGRNIVTEHRGLQTLRADRWSRDELHLFLYNQSMTIVLRRDS